MINTNKGVGQKSNFSNKISSSHPGTATVKWNTSAFSIQSATANIKN